MANMNVTYADMDNAAKTLLKNHQEIETMLQGMSSLVKQLTTDGFVTDAASKQFDQSYEEFTNGAKQVIQGMQGMSDYLTKASQTFAQIDQELAKAIK